MFYALVLQFYFKNGQKKKEDDTFLSKKTVEKLDFCRMQIAKGIVWIKIFKKIILKSEVDNNYKIIWVRPSLMGEVKSKMLSLPHLVWGNNPNPKKDLMNLIETNNQINMTSDHSVSSNISF